jgi:hypothetical protein
LKAKPTVDTNTVMKIVTSAMMASFDHEDVEGDVVRTEVSETA